MTRKGKSYSFKSLQAFEAVARRKTLAKAAEELGVTQSAVSHQIQRLTREIGEQLLTRSGRTIVLTDTGKKLAATLHHAFEEIHSTVAQVVGGESDSVRLALCSSFAPGWLVGRLDSFYRLHPRISLQLIMYALDPELTDRTADAFVTSFPRVAGYSPLKLRPEVLVPVYRDNGGNPRLSLITTDINAGETGADWIKYCALAGLPLENLHTGQWRQCSHYILALQLARQGLGMALVPDFLAAGDLASGSLRLLSGTGMPTNEDYFLCIKSSRLNEPSLRALHNWFRAQRETR
ncbi:MAG: LysR family transcriptional regulator [Parvibaculaceae bacterium]